MVAISIKRLLRSIYHSGALVDCSRITKDIRFYSENSRRDSPMTHQTVQASLNLISHPTHWIPPKTSLIYGWDQSSENTELISPKCEIAFLKIPKWSQHDSPRRRKTDITRGLALVNHVRISTESSDWYHTCVQVTWSRPLRAWIFIDHLSWQYMRHNECGRLLH